jgi:hypothetical protein
MVLFMTRQDISTTIHDTGPGYDYVGTEGRDPSSPLSGQANGIRYWRDRLPDRGRSTRASDAANEAIMRGFVGGVDAVSNAYQGAKNAASSAWDTLFD